MNSLQGDNKKNDKSFVQWSEETSGAFEKCKSSLVEKTMLSNPAVEYEMSIMVDASDNAVGAVVQQLSPKGWQPLSFFSRKLSTAEKKYSAYDRELPTECIRSY